MSVNEQQSIEHLLFNCRYAKIIWEIVEEFCGVQLSFEIILGIENTDENDYLLTLISFLIYKDWQLSSLCNKSRPQNPILHWYKQELNVRLNIYKRCTKFKIEHLDRLRDLIESFMQ